MNGQQWEVAGGKRIQRKEEDVSSKKQQPNKIVLKEAVLKIPRLETLPPLKMDSNTYDLIRESDDENDINNNKNKLKAKQQQLNGHVNNTTNSPKQSQPKKPAQEPLNLLSASVTSNQKKKTPNSPLPAKKVEHELENAVKNLVFEKFQQKYSQLENFSQFTTELILKQLVTDLNFELNQYPDIEPNVNHENETSFFPASKLDKKLEKFFNNLINKLKQHEAESLFVYSIETILSENPKISSYHGYKIIIQLLIKQKPGLLSNSSLHSRLIEILNANKHRHQKMLQVFWCLSQVGYPNLNDGLQVWFSLMLPLVTIRQFTNYIGSYLPALLNHHKQVTKSHNSLSLSEYLNLFDLINDKNILFNKDVSSKLKTAFNELRITFLYNLEKSNQNHFDDFFANLPIEKGPYQTEFLELLSRHVLSNREALSRWRKIYQNDLEKSFLLLEHMSNNHLKTLKNNRSMGDLLHQVDQRTSLDIIQLETSLKQKETKPGPYARKSQKVTSQAAELERIRKFNKLVKSLIKQNFQRVSFFSMVLRSVVIFTVITGLFFYWDARQNKSLYANYIKDELERYGLLEQTLKLINTVEKFVINSYKLVNHYVPIWYKKTADVVVPYTRNIWNFTVEYSNLAWKNSEPYRKQMIVYYEQASDYTVKNFPVFVKNLESVVQLAINYASTVINFVVSYTYQGLDFVGIQLGWKTGELERVILDGCKVLLSNVTKFFEWLDSAVNQQ